MWSECTGQTKFLLFIFLQSLLDGFEDLYNDSNYTDECCDGGDVCDLNESTDFEVVFIPVLYSVAFIVGILGNGVLLGVLAQTKKAWSVTDTFILHLGVADVMLLVTLPFWAAQAAQAAGWTFGTTLCQITGAIFTVRDVHQGNDALKVHTNVYESTYTEVTIFFKFLLFAPSDQLLLWDLSAGLHQSGPLPVHRSCYADVLPQKVLVCSSHLFSGVVFVPAPLYP